MSPAKGVQTKHSAWRQILWGNDRQAQSTSANHARSVRHCRDELDCGVDDRIFPVGQRPLHAFLPCFSWLVNSDARWCTDAKGPLERAELSVFRVTEETMQCVEGW